MNRSKETAFLGCFNTSIKWFLAIIMMTMAGLSFYQVVMRYAFNNAPSWSEELVRFLFIWNSFVAAAIGIREHIHIGVDVFVNLLPKKFIPLMEVVVNLGIIVFSVYMVWHGWSVTLMTHRQPSPALGIPMSLVYLSIPVMGVMLIFYCSLETLLSWKRFTAERRGA